MPHSNLNLGVLMKLLMTLFKVSTIQYTCTIDGCLKDSLKQTGRTITVNMPTFVSNYL